MRALLRKIGEHEGVQRYLLNTSWMLGEQILRLFAGLLVGIWVARYLGPEKFGVFSYSLAFVAIFASVAKLGMDSIVVRNLIQRPDKRSEYLATAFWLKVAGASTVVAAIAVAMLLIPNDKNTHIYILIIATGIFFQPFEIVDFYFQSKVLAKFSSICKIAQLLFSSVLKIYFVLKEAELIWFVVLVAIDQLILALTLFLAFAYRNKKSETFLFGFQWKTAKEMLKDSWPLIFSSLVVAIYMRIDQVMIKAMLGDHEAGVYSAAVRLSEAWYFIPTVICASLFPAVVNAKKNSVYLYRLRLRRLFALLVWMAIAIAIPISFINESLVVFLYGNEYREAGVVLAIHIWTAVFVFLGVASNSWYTSENLQRLAFARTLTGALINVTLNVFLIPNHGIVGAAIATLIAQAMAALFFDLFISRTRVLFFMKIKIFDFRYLFQKGH